MIVEDTGNFCSRCDNIINTENMFEPSCNCHHKIENMPDAEFAKIHETLPTHLKEYFSPPTPKGDPMKKKYEDYQYNAKVVRLCTAVMDACKTGIDTFTITQALNGETPSEEQKAFEKIIYEAGLQTGFFDNEDPLYARAEKKRNRYQRYLNQFKLL